MQVKIKSLDVNVDVKSNGIEFEVRNPEGSSQPWRLLPHDDRPSLVQGKNRKEERHQNLLA